MGDIPAAVHINEEGPREGFQIEKGPIPTARKIALIDALSGTGIDHMQIVSFVNPKAVPGMADADAVVEGIRINPDVAYTALWLNDKGFERALREDRLTLKGTIQLAASEKFLMRNQNRTMAQQLAGLHERRLLQPQDQRHGAQHEVVGIGVLRRTRGHPLRLDQQDFRIDLRHDLGRHFILQRQQIVGLAIEAARPDDLVVRPQIQKPQADPDLVASPLHRTIDGSRTRESSFGGT